MSMEPGNEPTGCEEVFAKVKTFGFEQPSHRTLSARAGASRFRALYGNSAAMTEVYQMMERVAPTEASVLIIGESGTGKELVANAIHQASKRAKGNFVAINCGAFSANLIE